MSFATIQDITRFSHFWDLVANSGNFRQTMTLIEEKGREVGSLYRAFDQLCVFLAQRHPQGHGVALKNLVESVWLYLTTVLGTSPETARQSLVSDYSGTVKRDIPQYLKARPEEARRKPAQPDPSKAAIPSRQQRHLSEPRSIC